MESKQSCNQRIQDVARESGRALSPITLENTPLKTIEESLQPLNIDDLESHLFSCTFDIEQLDTIPHGLTRDEAIAVRVYTMEWQVKEQSLYYKLNEALRTVSREAIKPYFAYMKLLFNGLAKLPSHQSTSMTLWRGVAKDISKSFGIGKKYFWWGFSSCTTDLNVLKGFLGNGPRVVFSINFLSHCCDIKEFSCFEQESEILLLPGRCFEVLNVGTVTDDGLTIVHLKEVSTPPMIKGVDFPVGVGSIGKKSEKPAVIPETVVVDSDFKEWFSGLGFSASLEVEYCKSLVTLGFDSLSVLMLLKENDFERYFSGFPPGHRMKIWNQISKMQLEKTEKEQKEKEQKEKEQREKEQREKEQREKEQREKEQREKEQREKEQREKKQVLTIQWNAKKGFNCINCKEYYYDESYERRVERYEYYEGYERRRIYGCYSESYEGEGYEYRSDEEGERRFELGDIIACIKCGQKCFKFI